MVLNPETKAKWENWECDQKLVTFLKKKEILPWFPQVSLYMLIIKVEAIM